MTCNFLIVGDPFFVQRRSFTSSESSHIRSGLEPMIFDLQDAVIQPLASVLFPMEGRVGPGWGPVHCRVPFAPCVE